MERSEIFQKLKKQRKEDLCDCFASFLDLALNCRYDVDSAYADGWNDSRWSMLNVNHEVLQRFGLIDNDY